ncbi:retrovirus-related pol polyprotein from transposon TNT 1-94 [Tanacetum coccineum]
MLQPQRLLIVKRRNNKCNFCIKDGHFQKDCPKGKAWLEKKGNRMKSPIEGVGTYRLKLDTGFHLDLMNTLYVPSTRNLISIPRFDQRHEFTIHKKEKIDSRTVSGYFIGYQEKSKGYRFYCPNHSSKIVETCNAKFLEKGEVSGSVENQVVDINEIRDDDPSPMNVHKSTTPDDVHVFQNQEQYLNNEQTPHEENNLPTQTSKPVGIANLQGRKSDKSEMWIDAMKEELKSMAENKVWDLDCLKRISIKFLRDSSIMEAELVACYEATIHALWLQNFISGLGVVDTVSKPLKIYYDNVATSFFSKNDKYSKGAKHMDIKFFIVKEEIQKQRVYLEHISTDLMIADPLTKGLPPKEFTQHVPRLGQLSICKDKEPIFKEV